MDPVEAAAYAEITIGLTLCCFYMGIYNLNCINVQNKLRGNSMLIFSPKARADSKELLDQVPH